MLLELWIAGLTQDQGCRLCSSQATAKITAINKDTRTHTHTCAVRRFWGSGVCMPGRTGSFPIPCELWMGDGCTEEGLFWTTGTWIGWNRIA